jgi:hypothetical protein
MDYNLKSLTGSSGYFSLDAAAASATEKPSTGLGSKRGRNLDADMMAGSKTGVTTGAGTAAASQPGFPPDDDNTPAQLYSNASTSFTNAGVNLNTATFVPSANPSALYNQEQFNIEDYATQIEDYLTGTAISDSLYDALKLPNPAYGGLEIVEDRPLTEQELKQYAPLLDLMNNDITVEELGNMDREDQEAFLKAIGTTGLTMPPRDSVFVGGEFDVATTEEEFVRDLINAGLDKQNKDYWSLLTAFKYNKEEAKELLNNKYGVVDVTPPEAADQELIPTTTAKPDVAPTVDTTPPAQTGSGLMSRSRLDGKDGDLSVPTQYGTAVFEMSTDLKATEGTEPHIGSDWENVTLALGIVPTSGLKIDGKVVPRDRATRGRWLKRYGYVNKNGKATKKFEKANIDTSGAVKDGVRRSDYSSDTAWSAAVINNFKQGAQKKVKDFDELGVDEQKVVIDLAWNMGVGGLDYTGNQSLIKELSKAPQDRDIPTMLEVGKHVTEGKKVMRGLARRKALAINELIDDPAEKITKIRQLSVGSTTYHTYINAVGEEVKTIKLGQRHSGSPDGIIDVATGDQVVAQEELDYSSVVVRPKLRPKK